MKLPILKPLFWFGSKKDLLALPVAVRKFFGYARYGYYSSPHESRRNRRAGVEK